MYCSNNRGHKTYFRDLFELKHRSHCVHRKATGGEIAMREGALSPCEGLKSGTLLACSWIEEFESSDLTAHGSSSVPGEVSSVAVERDQLKGDGVETV